MKRLFFFASLMVLRSYFSVASVFAAEEFTTVYKVRYEANIDGKMRVRKEISLTNKLSNIYATQYSLILKGIKIENFQAFDGEKELKNEIEQTQEDTKINLVFNQQIVGTGKTLVFHLNYDALGLATKNGQVWEINIPKLSKENPPDNYLLELAVPLSFGNLAFIKPQPFETAKENNFNIYRFNKDQLFPAGINAVFGEFQVFDFKIKYHLSNSQQTTGETEIPIPPDTALQKIFYEEINPPPKEINIDSDGNWLAKYRLGPNQKTTIFLRGKVKIFPFPQEEFLLINPNDSPNNLAAQPYWETDKDLIRQKAETLKTPRMIYDFVVATLDYDFTRVTAGSQRLGALGVLVQPNQATCREFTDLFIALCRAAGIPAREINGFAYTTNEKLQTLSATADVLHAWPEYWDEQKNLWVPVDPTWVKTTAGIDYFSKFDLNHFVFVIRGKNSQLPYVPGSYKVEDDNSKDIEVVFGDYPINKKTNPTVQFNLEPTISWLDKIKGEVIIKNPGPSAIYNLQVKIFSQDLTLKPASLLEEKISLLPPFANQKFPLELRPLNFNFKGIGELIVEVGEKKFVFPLKVSPLKLNWLSLSLIMIFLSGLLLILTTKLFYAKKLRKIKK